jgi:hypothetical protein
VQRAVQTSIDEIERHNRRIFEIAGLSADETAEETVGETASLD